MRKIFFNQLTWEDLASIIKLREEGIDRAPWEELRRGELPIAEKQIIEHVTAGLRRIHPSLVNNATLWSRAIFPLLYLAETERIVAQAQVPLNARIADVELSGAADGAFGTPLSGELCAPFLIIVEAKRGVEGQNPVAQLYGEILAAGCLNHQENGRPGQRIYGSYTVGNDWTFVRADIDALDTAHPSMSVVSS